MPSCVWSPTSHLHTTCTPTPTPSCIHTNTLTPPQLYTICTPTPTLSYPPTYNMYTHAHTILHSYKYMHTHTTPAQVCLPTAQGPLSAAPRRRTVHPRPDPASGPADQRCVLVGVCTAWTHTHTFINRHQQHATTQPLTPTSLRHTSTSPKQWNSTSCSRTAPAPMTPWRRSSTILAGRAWLSLTSSCSSIAPLRGMTGTHMHACLCLYTYLYIHVHMRTKPPIHQYNTYHTK